VELRYIPSGMAVTDIGLAVNDRVKRDGQWVDETTFVDITLWGRTAEIANEYLNKGSSVLIEGRLKLDSWETDGQKRSKLKVIGERMQMLGGKGGGGGNAGGGGGSGARRPSSTGGSSQRGGYNSQDSGPDEYDDSSMSMGGSAGGDDIPF